MIYMHLFVQGEPRGATYLEAVPRVGDEVRLGGIGSEKYYVVKRLVWCLDEKLSDGTGRVNMDMDPAP